MEVSGQLKDRAALPPPIRPEKKGETCETNNLLRWNEHIYREKSQPNKDIF
jgi:hypothetical protein